MLLPNIQIFSKKMTKTWCVGGRHKGNTNNITEYEKINPRTKKLVKIIKGSCSVCGRNVFCFYRLSKLGGRYNRDLTKDEIDKCKKDTIAFDGDSCVDKALDFCLN